jgi:hypothetical protein
VRTVTKGKELSTILDQCLERLLHGESVEQCLERYPEHAAELRPLLETASAASQALDIEPSEDFRARARYQLRAELDRQPPRRRWFAFGWQPRWVMVALVVLAIVLAGSGTVAAADDSMPDSPLYPVKLATENVRLALSSSDVRRAELYAALVERRVAEIAYLIEKGKVKRLERAAQRLRTYLAKMSALPLAPERLATTARAPSEQPATEQPQTTLTQREPMPEAAELSARKLAALRQERDRLRVLLGYYAVTHPARLRAILERAPDSAKPAIRRAIAVSVASYKEVLERLHQADAPEQPEGPEPNDEPQPPEDSPRTEQSSLTEEPRRIDALRLMDQAR